MCTRSTRSALALAPPTHRNDRLCNAPLEFICNERAPPSDPCLSVDVSHVAGHLRQGRARGPPRPGVLNKFELDGLRVEPMPNLLDLILTHPRRARRGRAAVTRQSDAQPAAGQQAVQGGARAVGVLAPKGGLACSARARQIRDCRGRERSSRPEGSSASTLWSMCACEALSGGIGRPTGSWAHGGAFA